MVMRRTWVRFPSLAPEVIIMAKKKNPYEVGDIVRISRDIKDAYCETWHHAEDEIEIAYIANDGEGLMFASELGIHFSEVKLVEKAPRCKCCGQRIPRE